MHFLRAKRCALSVKRSGQARAGHRVGDAGPVSHALTRHQFALHYLLNSQLFTRLLIAGNRHSRLLSNRMTIESAIRASHFMAAIERHERSGGPVASGERLVAVVRKAARRAIFGVDEVQRAFCRNRLQCECHLRSAEHCKFSSARIVRLS